MKKQLHFLLAILFAFTIQLQAQSELAPCGVGNYYSPWLRAYLDSGSPSLRSDDIHYVPLQIHIVGTDEGTGHMKRETVLRSFCTLNEDFADSDIQFFLANDLNYIDNTAYYDHDYSNGSDMMYEYNVDNVINCYIVDSPAGNCGYFTYGADAIALAKNCTQPNDHTWAHEVGHYLSLPHTFWGWEWAEGNELDFDTPAPNQIGNINVEKADGSNCANSADGFCDTPADYLNYRWSCNNEGNSNVIQIDPNGTEFTSEGGFYMSYSTSSCKARFSEEQTGAMRANIETQRNYLLSTAPDSSDVEIPVTENLIVLSPSEDALVETSTVLIEWEPIPNATHYIVQINPFPIFSIIFNEFIVEESSFEFSNLISDETFYWRVRPYNPYYTCSGFTDKSSFNTGQIVVGVNELQEGESLRLFPNPAKNGYIWMEITSLSSTTAQWEIVDVSGRIIQQGEEGINNGTQKISLDTHQLASGMYIAGLQLGDRKVFRKFIVD